MGFSSELQSYLRNKKGRATFFVAPLTELQIIFITKWIQCLIRFEKKSQSLKFIRLPFRSWAKIWGLRERFSSCGRDALSLHLNDCHVPNWRRWIVMKKRKVCLINIWGWADGDEAKEKSISIHILFLLRVPFSLEHSLRPKLIVNRFPFSVLLLRCRHREDVAHYAPLCMSRSELQWRFAHYNSSH